MTLQTADLPEAADYIPSFASNAEQRHLADALDSTDWDTTLKRRVQHFGYRYDYRARTVAADSYVGPLPDWLQSATMKLVASGHFHRLPDQVIANEYLPGQGISAHVDCEPCFGETIASLSLLSSCEMIFRHLVSGEKRALILEPGALLVMQGPSRYDWTHEIPGRRSDVIEGIRRLRERRISLKFRTVIATR